MRRAVIFALVASVSVSRAQPAPDAPPPPEPTPAPAPSAPPPDMPINVPPAPETPPDQPAPAPAPETTPAPAPTPEPAPTPAPEPSPELTTAQQAEEAATSESAAPAIASSRNKDAAWLFVGGALTFLTAGAVLAYSTSSVEQDIRDLYVTADNSSPEFDASTRERYEALQREGRRYEILAWSSFGLAAACAAGAAVFFVRASRESDVTVAPTVAPTGAGVSLSLRFD